MIKNSYVPRRIMEREKYVTYGEYAPYMGETCDISSLIKKSAKRIILLGDAGFGKSTELKFLAEKLMEEKSHDFIPIYVELNTYVDQDLKEFIRMKTGKDFETIFDKIYADKLLFLFDEYDQVLDKAKATRNIKNFMEEYCKSTFVIACRTNFYSTQFGEDALIAVLLQFTDEKIKEYVHLKLGAGGDNFLNELEKQSLIDLSVNPFFLSHLVDIYLKDKILPGNKFDIFSRIIDMSLQKDKLKLDKYDLEKKYPLEEIKKELAYLSLVMETLQRNYLSIAELRKIISDPYKAEVITTLSLTKKNMSMEGDVFQFQHNNFQEFLAAERLSKEQFPVIASFITTLPRIKNKLAKVIANFFTYTDVKLFGIKVTQILVRFLNMYEYKRLNRINPSWINTVSFLCAMPKQDKLLEYLINNEPELTLKFEKHGVSDTLKEKLFKIIFSKYADRKIWIDRTAINYEELANFAESKNIFEYLIKYARSKVHFVHRYNALQILGKIKIRNTDNINELKNLLIKYANDNNENSNVRHISLYVLAWLNITDEETLSSVIGVGRSTDDLVVAGLYYLARHCVSVDKYIGFLMDSFAKRERSNLLDLGMNFEKLFERVKSPTGVKDTLETLALAPDKFLNRYHQNGMLEEIIATSIEVFKSNVSVYDKMKKLLLALDKKYYEKSAQKIIAFFERTNTRLKLFKEIYSTGLVGNYSVLAILSDVKTIGYLSDENIKGALSDKEMQIFINYLYSRNPRDSNAFIKIITEKTGKFQPVDTRNYEKEREDKTMRKINIIFRKDEFVHEVEKIFREKNINMVDYEILHEMLKDQHIEDDECNEFVIRETLNMLKQEKEKKYDLISLKEKISNFNFEHFTISHIYNLLQYDGENRIQLKEDQIDFIKDYCLKYVKIIDFKMALTPKDQGESAKVIAIHLWYFLRKFDFRYPEDVLLDMLSFDWIEGHQFLGIDYLEAKLPEPKIKKRIIENLTRGNLPESALRNHIKYCKKHNQKEAVDLLYSIINNEKVKEENRLLALDAIAKWPEYDYLLENLLECKNIRFFTKVSKILMQRNNFKCRHKLVSLLKAKEIKLSVEASKILIDYQELDGIVYYIDYNIESRKFEGSMRDKNPIQKIVNPKALPALIKLLKFSYKFRGKIVEDRFDRLDNSLTDSFRNMALQSFESFLLVIRSLRKFIRKYDSRFQGVNFLNSICDDIERDFFTNYSQKISVDDAKSKVDMLILKCRVDVHNK